MYELESIVEHLGEELRDLYFDITNEECSEIECLKRLSEFNSKVEKERLQYINKHSKRLAEMKQFFY